ncbi:DUF6086 family protein [Actinoallomurus sp. NPDC052274]|uniref:DUF6086 family protein n=1 Tax=Actinoallomurus sp. NPDC052274 TaxID=3155420 RepID=UPI00342C619B
MKKQLVLGAGYFQVDDRVLWNPSNGVARVFVRTAEVLVPEAELPTGLGPMVEDECQVDMAAFTAFVRALIGRYEASNHRILRSLMEDFIAVALVLVERGGGTLRPSDPPVGWQDVQAGPGTELPPSDQRGGTERWAALVAEYARAMPH